MCWIEVNANYLDKYRYIDKKDTILTPHTCNLSRVIHIKIHVKERNIGARLIVTADKEFALYATDPGLISNTTSDSRSPLSSPLV